MLGDLCITQQKLSICLLYGLIFFLVLSGDKELINEYTWNFNTRKHIECYTFY